MQKKRNVQIPLITLEKSMERFSDFLLDSDAVSMCWAALFRVFHSRCTVMRVICLMSSFAFANAMRGQRTWNGRTKKNTQL